MKKIAVYARVSTDHEDQKNSVENQELYFKDYISKEDGWQLYKMYADEGISGTSLKHREQFNRMIEDAKKGKFDVILTKEVCRFARNTLDTIEKTRELKRLGVEIRFLIDNISTFDSDGELRLTIMAGLAQDESRRTSERVQFGVIQQMKKGVAFRNIMYGYEFKNGKLIVNEKEAEMIRKIYHWYLDDGYGCYKIAQKLKEEHYELKRPKDIKNKYNWQSSTIREILKNEKYIGDLKQRITYTVDYLEHKQKKNNGEVEFIYIKDHHEPIIDRELFNRVQIELARRNKMYSIDKTNYSNIHELSGKVVCGICGNGFISSKGKPRKDGSYRSCWKCKNKVNHGEEHYINGTKVGCNSERVSDVSLKNAIIKSIALMKENKEKILEKLQKSLKNYFETILGTNYNVDEVVKQRKEYERKKEKLVELYLNDLISKEMFDKKDKKLKEQLEITEEIRQKDLLKQQILEDKETITQSAISSIKQILEYKNITKDVFRKIINKVVIHDKTHIDIYFNEFKDLKYLNSNDSIVGCYH